MVKLSNEPAGTYLRGSPLCYLLSITAATHHLMHLTQRKRLYGWLVLHIEYKLCKCSLMVKTDRGAEGKRGTINQHLSELPHLVWNDVSSASQRHWMQTSQHSCSMTVGMIGHCHNSIAQRKLFFFFHFSLLCCLFFLCVTLPLIGSY